MKEKCNHLWIVFSTAIHDRVIMLECQKCGAFGTVDNFTKEEWNLAFFAPSNPFIWIFGNHRVIHRADRI